MSAVGKVALAAVVASLVGLVVAVQFDAPLEWWAGRAERAKKSAEQQQAVATLAEGRALWKAQRPSRYRYSVAVYGGGGVPRPVAVTVRDGASTGPDGLATIDQVFDTCEDIYRKRHHSVSFDLDPKWGFPRSATMSANMPEGDSHVEVRDFQVLP